MARHHKESWYDKAEAVRHGVKTFTRYALPVASTVATLAALINIEKKYYDVTQNFTFTSGIGNAGTAFPLTANIPQGDGQSQCIGNSIKLLSCYLKYRITSNTTQVGINSTTGATLRVIVVADRDANGVAPTLTDVLEVSSMLSPLNKATSFASGQEPRFHVLLDKVHNVPRAGDGETGFHEHYWDQHHKLGEDHHCLWSNDTHLPSTILGGHIFVFCLYSNLVISSTAPTYTTDTTNPPGMQVYSRVRYTDD